jgi:hypothetical protein
VTGTRVTEMYPFLSSQIDRRRMVKAAGAQAIDHSPPRQCAPAGDGATDVRREAGELHEQATRWDSGDERHFHRLAVNQTKLM